MDRGILPGMQELVRRIGDDERRHMAWGTFTCRRHVAADDANWAVFETRMNELIPLALRNTEEGSRSTIRDVPFDLTMDEFMQYAADKGMRRLGTISSARGRPVGDIDVDYSPLQLEDAFADEDRKALAASEREFMATSTRSWGRRTGHCSSVPEGRAPPRWCEAGCSGWRGRRQ